MTLDLRLTLHYALTIFLSAFLLFQVQPMIGKMILPWFGGSASVWTTCMLFFQVTLLLGYGYSHFLVRRLSPRAQSLLHIALIAASLAMLPIGPGEGWKPQGDENPTLRILGLLAASIGLPYFVLSTTGPLVQAWFARERSGHVPYRLFALSNFGSMIALLAYPVAFEPAMPTRWQSWSWSALFVLFGLSCALLAWRGRNAEPIPLIEGETEAERLLRAPWSERALWIALAACPSIMMVADTSFLTENIAPIPMLWVAPLALYLLSFILCFESSRWYRRAFWLPLLAAGLLAIAVLPVLPMRTVPVTVSIAINLVAFLALCMACHGELALRQPHPSQLTVYYLMLALGGCLGGVFVGLVAPYAFNGNYELSVGLIVTALVVTIALMPAMRRLPATRRTLAGAAAGVLVAALAGVRLYDHVEDAAGMDVAMRNFYGSLKVFTNHEDRFRSMVHGQIVHGRQFTDEARVDQPTTYYSAKAGVGRALSILAARGGPLRVGVVGLGVGTLAAYGRPGDTYRLYDIDPQVLDVARSHFRYLERSKAANELVLGDARLRLEREDPQRFDLLVIDAFSGDSVPVHLLTREAFAQYVRHLAPGGVLAVHITNKFLDLRPVVATGARAFGREARVVDHASEDDDLIYRSRWVLVAPDAAFFADPSLADAQPIDVPAGFRPWQDDYSSLFSILM